MDCNEMTHRIIDGFQKNRNAFIAIGDETRLLILIVLPELVNTIYDGVKHICEEKLL